MTPPVPEIHEARLCDSSLTRAFGLLGKRWNGVIIGTLANGPAGFSELRRAVNGISDSVLSDRLTELTAASLVLRVVSEGPPVSVEYRLSSAGEALVPSMKSLTLWAEEHLVN